MPAPDFREKLLACLGGDWPKPCPLNVWQRETIQKTGYRIKSVFYDSESTRRDHDDRERLRLDARREKLCGVYRRGDRTCPLGRDVEGDERLVCEAPA